MKRSIFPSLSVLLSIAGLAWGQAGGEPASGGSAHPSAAAGTVVLGDAHPVTGAIDAAPACAAPDTGPDSRVYGNAEYLLWWTRRSPLPASLITTGPLTGNPGSLDDGGVPLTRESLDPGALSGVRVNLGFWLDDKERLGVEVGGFILPRQTRTVAFSSDASGNPVLAFRHLDPPTDGAPAEDVFQAAVPGVVSAGPPQIGPYAGAVGLTTATRLWGLEGNLVGGACQCDCVRWQLLAGVRYLELSESLDLAFERQAIPGSGAMVMFEGTPYPDPSAVSALDSFQTRNQFYGGQVGARGELGFGRGFLAFAGKLALGDLHESLNVIGSSTLVQPGLPNVTVPGGLFAAASNSGRVTRDEFAVLPEAEIDIGYQLNANVRVYIGYNILYLNRVARPGSQVDQVVDTRGTPIDPGFTGETTTYPRPVFNDTNFWAQGIDFGVQLSY